MTTALFENAPQEPAGGALKPRAPLVLLADDDERRVMEQHPVIGERIRAMTPAAAFAMMAAEAADHRLDPVAFAALGRMLAAGGGPGTGVRDLP